MSTIIFVKFTVDLIKTFHSSESDEATLHRIGKWQYRIHLSCSNFAQNFISAICTICKVYCSSSNSIFGSFRSSGNQSVCLSVHLSVCPPVCLSVCLSVHLSGTSLSKALNLHLSPMGQSQVSLRSVSGLFQVSARSVPDQSQVSLFGLSSVRRSLKYFVLFRHRRRVTSLN